MVLDISNESPHKFMMDWAMPTQEDPVQVYKELSEWYDRRSEPPMRDRFLVLAADAALRAGRVEEADRLRHRLLKLNPHHMLKPYGSFAQAMQAPDVQTYIRDLRMNYPPEVALVLLNSLRTTGPKADQTFADSPGNAGFGDDAPSTVALDTAHAEPLRVYHDQRESDVTETAALPPDFLDMTARPTARQSQPQPKTPLPPARPAAPPKSAARAPAAPPKKKPAPTPHPEPVAPSPYLTGDEAESSPSGGWFAAGLFVLISLAGVGVAVYTFARPFLSLPQ